MRRVYAIWFVKKILSPAVLKGGILVSILYQLKEYVSLRHVVGNAPSLADFSASFSFLASAFFHTQAMVQLLSIGLLAFGIWFVRDLLRGYSFFDSSRYNSINVPHP